MSCVIRISKRALLPLVFGLLTVLLELPAAAQEMMQVVQNMPGFKPVMSYQDFGKGETVNPANGGLTVVHPSAIALPQNMGGVLQPARVYNSKDPDSPWAGCPYTDGPPVNIFGVGWSLSYGRVFVRTTSIQVGKIQQARAEVYYRDESGADHRLYRDSTTEAYSGSWSPSTSAWYYTNDSSFIRAKYATSFYGGTWTIYFPDGSTRTAGGTSDSYVPRTTGTCAGTVPGCLNPRTNGWYVRTLTDRAGNTISITYYTYSPLGVYKYPGAINTITDNITPTARTIQFTYYQSGASRGLVSQIEGAGMKESFEYATEEFLQYSSLTLPVLKKVKAPAPDSANPEANRLETLYFYDGFSGSDDSGTYLTAIAYPTGAFSEYFYKQYHYHAMYYPANPNAATDYDAYGMGVSEHALSIQLLDASHTHTGWNRYVWTYDRDYNADSYLDDNIYSIPVVVKDPLGAEEIHFFGAKDRQFDESSDFTPGKERLVMRRAPGTPGRFDPYAPTGIIWRLRKYYASGDRVAAGKWYGDARKCKHENASGVLEEVPRGNTRGCGSKEQEFSSSGSTNWTKETVMAGWDGFGHYRVIQSSGTPAAAHTTVSVTKYNFDGPPYNGTPPNTPYQLDQVTLQLSGGMASSGLAAPLLLPPGDDRPEPNSLMASGEFSKVANTYDSFGLLSSQVTTGNLRTDFLFSFGPLSLNDTTPAPTPLYGDRTITFSHTNGNITHLTYSGGDGSSTVGASFTWECGTGKSLRFDGMNYDDFTRSIDPATSRILSQTGADTKTTTFAYYDDGRLETITPPDEFPEQMLYPVDSTTFNGSSASLYGCPGACPSWTTGHIIKHYKGNTSPTPDLSPSASTAGIGTLETYDVYSFDDLGRLWKSNSVRPDGYWSEKTVFYDALDRAVFTSEPYGWSESPSANYRNMTGLNAGPQYGASFEMWVPSGSGGNDYGTWDSIYADGPFGTTPTLDPFYRTVKLIKPDGKAVTTSYSGLSMSVTYSVHTESGDSPSTTQTTKDVLGRIVTVLPPQGAPGGYTYCGTGQVKKVVLNGTQNREFEYDGLGRLRSEKHPELLNLPITYSQYDALGNLLKYDDPLGRSAPTPYSILKTYDAKGRLRTTETVNSATGTRIKLLSELSYYEQTGGHGTYAKGKLTHTIAYPEGAGDIVEQDYVYEGAGGRISSKSVTVGSRTMGMTYDQHNLMGQLEAFTSTVGPTGQQLSFPISRMFKHGALQKAVFFNDNKGVGNLTYHPSGALHVLTYTNGSHLTFDEESTSARLAGISLDGPASWGTGTFSYDGAGNITTMASASETAEYKYDLLSRVVNAAFPQQGSGPRTFSYTYDAYGNLTARTSTSQAGDGVPGRQSAQGDSRSAGDSTFPFQASIHLDSNGVPTNRISTVVAATGKGRGGESTLAFTYDANGNVIDDGEHKYKYDSLNRQISVSDQAGNTLQEFSYDVSGERIRAKTFSGGSLTKEGYYLREGSQVIAEELLDYTGGPADLAKAYLYTGGNLATTEQAALTPGPPPPSVSSVTPSSGPVVGGTSVTIAGSNFVSGASVTFGGTAATGVTVSDATTITCTTPAHAAGSVDVKVTNPDGQSATLAGGYTYTGGSPAPTIVSVSPNSGPGAGGTSVSIAGTNFVSGTGLAVTFGGATPSGVTWVSSTTITCTTPAHAAGVVDVKVTNPDGQSATLPGGFTYTSSGPPPVIGTLAPTAGPASGGTSVTITGSNFVNGSGLGVTFGGNAASNVSFVSSSTISCTTPAHAAGTVDVKVTNPDGQSTTKTSAFTYSGSLPPPTVTSVDPTWGPLAGGTPVHVYGTNFVSGATVWFGTAQATGVTLVSASQINCVTSAYGTSTTVDVKVTNPDGQFGVLSQGYWYTNIGPGPTIVSISPTTGPREGGTLVTITGQNFHCSPPPSVSFGGSVLADVNCVNSTTITFYTPVGTGSVAVYVNDWGGMSNAVYFTYYGTPSVTSIYPTSGTMTGGTDVTIYGNDFSNASGYPVVKFGNNEAVVTYYSTAPPVIAVKSPAALVQGQVHVTVTTSNGTSAQTSADLYTYTGADAPTVTKVTPNSGPDRGGTNVTLMGTLFSGVTAVYFGESPATSFSISSATQITAVSPPHSAGIVNVTVIGPGGQSSATTSNRYTYNSVPPGGYTITLSFSGLGTVSAVPSGPYPINTTATIIATPNLNYTFTQWKISDQSTIGGNTFNSTTATTQLLMDRNYWATATFRYSRPRTTDLHTDAEGRYQIELAWQDDPVPGMQAQIAYREPSAFVWEYTEWLTPNQDENGNYSLLFNPPSGCTLYLIMIRLFDPATGKMTDWSEAAEARSTVSVPSAPLYVFKTCNYNREGLAWNVVPEEACAYSEFRMYRSDDGIDFKLFKTIPAKGETTYWEGTDQACNAYKGFYRLSAVIGETEGPYLDAGSSPPKPPPEPDLTLTHTLSQPDIKIGDLSGDVAYDLVLQNAYFKANPDGTFTDASGDLHTTAGNGDLIRIVHMDGDGLVDRVIASHRTLWIESNSPSGTFSLGPSITLDENIECLVIGHAPFTVNGSPQVIVGSRTKLTFMILLPGGEWTVFATQPVSLDLHELALGDLNNDGLTDILAGGRNGASVFFMTADDFGIWHEEPIVSGEDVPSVAIADANGDGFLDIALARQGPSDPLVFLFTRIPESDPEIRPVPHTWTPGALAEDFSLPNVRQVVFGDLDGSGLPGLFCVTEQANQSSYFKNNGAGGLLPSDLVLPGKVTAVAIGDFDENGALDFAAVGVHTLDVYEGEYASAAMRESALENEPPAPPSDVFAVVGQEWIELSWLAGSDDRTPAAGLTYEVIAGTAPDLTNLRGGEWGPQSTTVRPGNNLTGTRAVIAFPRVFTEVYWAIRSIDTSYLKSPWLRGVTHSDGTTELLDDELRATRDQRASVRENAAIQPYRNECPNDAGDSSASNTTPWTPILLASTALTREMAHPPRAPISTSAPPATTSARHTAAAAIPAATTAYFYAWDQVGNIRVVMKEDGTAASKHDWEPFGFEFNTVVYETDNTHKFGTYERDDATGNDFAHFRFYASSMGRFMKPDNVPGNLLDPQSWNKYSYCGNNPVNRNDPTGHWYQQIGSSRGSSGMPTPGAFWQSYEPTLEEYLWGGATISQSVTMVYQNGQYLFTMGGAVDSQPSPISAVDYLMRGKGGLSKEDAQRVVQQLRGLYNNPNSFAAGHELMIVIFMTGGKAWVNVASSVNAKEVNSDELLAFAEPYQQAGSLRFFGHAHPPGGIEGPSAEFQMPDGRWAGDEAGFKAMSAAKGRYWASHSFVLTQFNLYYYDWPRFYQAPLYEGFCP